MKSTSLQSRLATTYFFLSDRISKHSKKWFLRNSPPIEPYGIITDQVIEKEEFKSRPLWRINMRDKKPNRHVIFIHGGAFAKNFQRKHWQFIHQLVQSVRAEVIAPDYPLLPDSTFLEINQYFLGLFKDLSHEIDLSKVVIIADTSGATIVLNVLQQFQTLSLSQPKELILLSPWLDLSLSNPNIDDLIEKDPIHDIAVLKELALAYAGNLEINNPVVSPMYADTRRLAPITVFVGSRDIFLADCRKLKTLSNSKPVIFNYREYYGMTNNWMYYNFPESKKAREYLYHQFKSKPSEFEQAMQENVINW